MATIRFLRVLHKMRKVLPSDWRLRVDLWLLDRHYAPRIASARGEERDRLIHEHMFEHDMAYEEYEGIQMARLWRLTRKRKYLAVAIPERTGVEDENWAQGSVYGTWYLKRRAAAEVWRQIYDVQKRRREVVESWVKIATATLPWLTALVSALVSLTLAGRIVRP